MTIRLTPENVVAAAAGSVRMEGLPVSAEQRDMLAKVAASTLSGSDAHRALLARYAPKTAAARRKAAAR